MKNEITHRNHHYVKINKKLIALGLLAFFSSPVCLGAYNISIGIPLDIPVNVVIPNKTLPAGRGLLNGNSLYGAISMARATSNSNCYDPNNLKQGWSSDKKVFGYILGKDVILGFTGSGTNNTAIQYQTNNKLTGGWSTNAFMKETTYSGGATSCNKNSLGGFFSGQSNSLIIINPGDVLINGSLVAYAGPKAKDGDYYATVYVMGALEQKKIMNDIIHVGSPPRECTVNTKNVITFPPIDITNPTDGKSLSNESGSFSIKCDDASNAPVTIQIQGNQGRSTDTLALTMNDGSKAPAEVRGFIGSNIPLNGECNSRLSGANGVVHFTPNAGAERIQLAPGDYQYNWVLCSTGHFKTGHASATAKITLNWD